MSKKGRRNVAFNKQKILENIAKNEPYGRHTLEIAHDTEIYRSTITRLCNQLENDNWIIKKHKQAEYHLTQKAYGDPGLRTFLFSSQSIRKIMDTRISILNKFCKKYVSKNTSEEEESLFIFAIKMGALITYVMKEAMRPNKPTLSINNIETEVILKGKKKDELARKWVNDAISSIGILWEFTKLVVVKRGLAVWNLVPINYSLPATIGKSLIDIQKNSRQFKPQNQLWSKYEMDEDNFKKIDKAYENIFPHIFRELEKIRNELPLKIDWYKQREKDNKRKGN